MADRTPVDKVAKDLDYQTPRRVLDQVDAYCGGQIGLDPASTLPNPTNARLFCAPGKMDGLEISWAKPPNYDEEFQWVVFVNPPYGKEVHPWLAKIAEEASNHVRILALLAVNRTEQQYMQDAMYQANAVCWIRKRVPFLRPTTGKPAKQNPYSSALWGFNVDQAKFVEQFSKLGLVQLISASTTLVVEKPEPKAAAKPKPKTEAAVKPIGKMSKAELLAELARAGKLSNHDGPIGKQPPAVLRGMVQKLRTDQEARAAGAGDCPKHADQVEGACPICRGIWEDRGEPESGIPADVLCVCGHPGEHHDYRTRLCAACPEVCTGFTQPECPHYHVGPCEDTCPCPADCGCHPCPGPTPAPVPARVADPAMEGFL